ncbi:solute carrier family 25 (mitochondrial carrier protein), member 16 [Cryptococcus gattii E566]|uniref:Coenzyme A transporter, putative n=2 Tax=Cryptococcus gattii TaxID=37769 RepID=E6RCG9_CRYGW|nr:coenzyme A transporter, putative [Cryptococcus gattii WM276]ADV24476.1 coenzyme A transporter, putative [Cryptococcus gattii WM276]KIR76165.1 solute carrier family 25 (mitochondrial carrier protein), member 16 [Cryptococcus gattii EJB2]KIY30905.1 solute carrier family 25 (mitochondrial carrier protein), member 16 [Cryptococcus gattii E566]KJE01920.1 solute carrier family 25 (mitochondrial carrier protein), member 16 [Cryptococcus gattii NT-10]
MFTQDQPGPSSSTISEKGKQRASTMTERSSSHGPLVHTPLEESVWPPARESERWTASASDLWRQSRERAKTDRDSWDYVLSSGIAGGIAGCVAKTSIAPLDRVKILFQTSNAEFTKYAGTPMGLLHAISVIYKTSGVRGLFQGHSVTLLRIFPYAAIKYMMYDWLERLLIGNPNQRNPQRFFLAGSASGVCSVMCTYPLELIRVRLAYQTKKSERTSLVQAIKTIYQEAKAPVNMKQSQSVSPFVRNLPMYPFYRGFSMTIMGMIPYAGVSFLTYGTLKRHAAEYIPYFGRHLTARDLACGAVAGAVSQTTSYPFEVVRRRMQVGGTLGNGGIGCREAVKRVYDARGWRGFFVGLSIGYLKVVPMTSISFATWQLMKRLMEIS